MLSRSFVGRRALGSGPVCALAWILAGLLAVVPPARSQTADEPEPVPTSESPEPEAGSGGQSAEEKVHRVGLVVESSTAGARVFVKIPGAKNTVLAAAHEWDYGLRLFSEAEWRRRAYELEAFYAEAERTADAVVEAMEPRFLRDSREVIEYALIESEDPFLASAITSSRFLERFREQLGEDLRVVIVDRHIAYVFPAIGGRLEEYSPAIAEIYRTARFPGSLEVFQVNKDGYRVVGTIEG